MINDGNCMVDNNAKIAYFCMGIGHSPQISCYSGGLEIFAGDLFKSAAEKQVPFVGVNLFFTNGYFRQRIVNGRQIEDYDIYYPERNMKLLPVSTNVKIENRNVVVKTWLYNLKRKNYELPILNLTTDVNENDQFARDITKNIYHGDKCHRLRQEIVLGIGGVRMLEELGFYPEVYHINEGHGAFALIELRKRYLQVKNKAIFTTHTPVPAGHDSFDYEMVYRVMGENLPEDIKELAGKDELNMTLLALNLTRYANGVSKLHSRVSNEMFPGFNIKSIANGVHSYTWTSFPFQRLFDRKISGWREDPSLIREAKYFNTSDLLDAHTISKSMLIEYINNYNCTGTIFDKDTLTIGFARRFALYKRADLILNDLKRLSDVARKGIQIVFAGKAHPNNEEGKDLIHKIIEKAWQLNGKVRIAFLANQDIYVTKLMTSGSDIWLNTPLVSQEASGTSGMKAAHNGVPQISTIDGWWNEVQPFGGWSFGPNPDTFTLDQRNDWKEADELYNLLEEEVIPTYNDTESYAEKMREAIQNASYFNTHRTLDDYLEVYALN